MINGWEAFFEKYKKKENFEAVYGSIKRNGLVHDVELSGSGLTHTGVGPSESFALIAELFVGQENYRALFDCQQAYEDAVRTIGAYQKNEKIYQQTLAEIASAEANLKDLENKYRKLNSKSVHDMTIAELQEVENLSSQIVESKKQLEDLNQSLLMPNKGEVMQAILNLDEKEKNIELKKILNKNEIINFKSFHDELCQDFVDMTLLPGEEKREKGMMAAGDAFFTAYKHELDNLVKGVELSRQLLSFVEKNGLNAPLTEKMINDFQMSKEQSDLTTVVLEDAISGHFARDPKIAQAYKHSIEVTIPETIADKNQYAVGVNNLWSDYNKLGLKPQETNIFDFISRHTHKYCELRFKELDKQEDSLNSEIVATKN